jgi:DNA-3-methyladenine glycosylase II
VDEAIGEACYRDAMTPDYWLEACSTLSRRDRRLGRLIESFPHASLRTRGDAFATLARSIVGQQISVKAAETVWQRFSAKVGRMTARSVLRHSPEALREVGLSTMKAAYLRDLSERFASGAIRPRRWANMDDEAVIADLTQVKGIGRWTVEMFLIFYLMRPDVYPVDDIGLIRAIEKLYNKGERLDKAAIRAHGERWAPWRSVATWYLWRSLDPIPVEY